jgi:hypothetical protein
MTRTSVSILALAALAALAACTQAAPKPEGSAAAATAAPAQAAAPAPVTPVVRVNVTDATFGCIRKMTPVRGFYVGNVMGNLDETVKAASSTTGAVYPAGSVVQLVPTEAMVKREAGYNAATKDWEFFELTVAPNSTAIRVRGATDVVNRFGGNCLTCHAQAQPQWDMICEQTHGCAPIPVTPVMAKAIQNTDPRCEAMALPPDQAEALRQLQAAMSARPAAN